MSAIPGLDGIVRFGRFTVDARRRRLEADGVAVALRPRSFEVLMHLVAGAGQVVTREALLAAAWPGLVVTDESLSRCVSDIRLALDDRRQEIVKTVPGRGYVLAVHPDDGLQATMTSSVAGDPSPTNDATPDRPSIAVLPFATVSPTPDHDFLAVGLTEDITAALCRLDGFFVIAQNSMSGYRGRVVDVREVGRDLAVRYALQGSVRSHAGKLRVTVQLLATGSGEQLWAERYDRTIDDLFAILDDITLSVVGRLGSALLAAEYARGRRKSERSLGAWECVVRALHHSSQQSDEDTRTALALLDRALSIEPDHAQALGMQAWILVFRAFQGWEPMPEVIPRATAQIARAIAADRDELWPYLAQGMVAFALRDIDRATSALERAVALSPGSVNAHGLLGIAHAFGGRADAAFASIGRAMRLSPLDTYLSDFDLYNAFAHFQAGAYDVALACAEQAHRLHPGHAYPLVLAASCAGHAGRVEAGRHYVMALRTLMPAVSSDWIEQTTPYALAADRARLVAGLRRVGLS